MSYDEVNVAGNYTLNYDSTLLQTCGIKWKLWKFKISNVYVKRRRQVEK